MMWPNTAISSFVYLFVSFWMTDFMYNTAKGQSVTPDYHRNFAIYFYRVHQFHKIIKPLWYTFVDYKYIYYSIPHVSALSAVFSGAT